MSPLVEAFRSEPAEGAGPPAGHGGDDASLEAELAAACARGRAACGQLALDDRTFARHLGRIAKTAVPEAIGAWLSALAIEDLYLACACLTECEGAAALLDARYGPTIRGAIARIVGAAEVDEAHQQLIQALLVRSATTPAKIGSYAGKAPLERWLGVAAQRTALMWLRENRAESRVRKAAAAELAGAGRTHPEMAYMKERYRSEFEQALTAALERLPERDRVLLRMYLVNGVSIEKIGAMFSVSQPTASRWLAAARQTLLDDIKKALGSRLGTSSAELASLAGMVASRLDLSLSMLLKAR